VQMHSGEGVILSRIVIAMMHSGRKTCGGGWLGNFQKKSAKQQLEHGRYAGRRLKEVLVEGSRRGWGEY